MIPLNVTRGARHRCSKNALVERELRDMQGHNFRWFRVQDLAKRTNHVSNGIGNVLRFTTGVRCEGKGLWVFTGEEIEVMK